MAASDLEVDIGASMRTGPGNELTAWSTDSAILARAGQMRGHTNRRKAHPKSSGAVEVPEAAPRAALPDFIPPELATLVDRAPDTDRWLHEIKFDGYRTAAHLRSGRVRMLSRKGLDWTARFQPIAKTLAGLPALSAYLDGEVAVVGKDGVTSFAELQDVLSNGPAERLVYYAFDLLHLDGRDLIGLPLVQRKKALQTLLAGLPKGSPVHYSEHVIGTGQSFFRHACKLRLEGIVSKLAEGRYRPGRGREWLKVKCVNRQEFVVGGWMPSEAAGRDLRSLLVGYYQDGKLVLAGKVGTGFTLESGRELAARLRKLERADPPFATVPREYRRGVI